MVREARLQDGLEQGGSAPSTMPQGAGDPLRLWLIALSVWTLCGALPSIFVALHKRDGRPAREFFDAPAGLLFLVATALILVSVVVLISALRRSTGSEVRNTILLNLGSVALVALVAEVSLRGLVRRTAVADTFGHVALLPKSWSRIAARNRGVLARARAGGSFLVFDGELGWTIAKSAQSGDYNRRLTRQHLLERARAGDSSVRVPPEAGSGDADLYASSREGLRSGRAGISLADTHPSRRIALVGDSFTFGLEVRYENTWGAYLEPLAGAGAQVLNFGVDGYGIDQDYLRYRRDVTPWKPEIVVLGVISDDFRRTMCVYGFLCFPGAEIPFPKPRFVVADSGLRQLNAPLPTPESISAQQSIEELPFIKYDVAYDPVEWETHFYDHAYTIRVPLSIFRRWPAREPVVSDSAMRRVNAALIKAFLLDAHRQGSRAIVVYFPSGDELRSGPHSPSLAQEVLRQGGIPFLDMTDCVERVPPDERFVVFHYSATTNAAVASCLARALRLE